MTRNYFLLLLLINAPFGWSSIQFDINNQNSAAFSCPVTELDWLAAKERVALALSSNTDLHSRVIENCLKELEKSLINSPKLQACFSDLMKFNKELKSTPSSVDAYVAKDPLEYYKNAAPHVEVPQDLQSQVFLESLDSGDLESVELYLKKQNVLRLVKGLGKLEYVHLPRVQVPSIDRTGAQRFLIYDPGTRPTLPYTEKWISFTVGGGKNTATQLSVVATHWNQEGRSSTYFADHSRVKRQNEIHIHTSLETAKKESKPQVPNCYECHSNGGPITLHSTTPVAEKYADTLKRINERIAEIPMGYSPEFDPKRLKIGRDPIDLKKLPDKFILSCFDSGPKTVSPESISQVRNALSCHSCHDGENRAKLSVRYLEDTFTFRFRGGTMPPNHNLNREERFALNTCVNRYLSQIGRNDGSHPGMLFYQLFDPQCDVSNPGEARQPKSQKPH